MVIVKIINIDSVQEMVIFHISLSHLSQMSGPGDETLRQQNKKLVVVVGDGDGRVLCLSRTILVSASSSLIVSSHGTW